MRHTFRIRRQHGLVGQHVELAGTALGGLNQQAQSCGVKQLAPLPPGLVQAKHQVGRRVLGIERLQFKPVADPVLDLPELRCGQQFVQLGLAKQHNFQQFVLGRFQVGQQADFLQRGRRHAVRLVDHDHHAPALGVTLDEDGFQRREHVRPVALRRLGHQVAGNGAQNFVAVKNRVGQVNRVRRQGPQPLQQHAAEHGFAHADFTHHTHDSLVMHGSNDQSFEDVATLASGKEESCVGCNAKRIRRQAEVI